MSTLMSVMRDRRNDSAESPAIRHQPTVETNTEQLSLREMPTAVYRLQFNRDFTFADAGLLVNYLGNLGISDCYAAPFLKACAGSRHGYDIVDHGQLNPEIGTRDDLAEFSQMLQRNGMHLLLDVVPNHMGISSNENYWWNDVLENGRSSSYAAFFDIDWRPQKDVLEDKVLLPVLEDQFGKVLEEGRLELQFDDGVFYVRYDNRRFPISPHSWQRVLKHRLLELEQRLANDNVQMQEFQSILFSLGHLPNPREARVEAADERRREKEVVSRRLKELCSASEEIRNFVEANIRDFNGQVGMPETFDLLDQLLDEQPYRLAHWKVASDEINYRRFFDVNDLAALRTEHDGVFTATHRLIFELVESGAVIGLRIDHPDGLFDPVGYLHRMQSLAPTYIVVEKILESGESLPGDWPVQGTTGYDFLNAVNGLFVDRAKAKVFDRVYTKFIQESINYKELVYRCKKLIMLVSLSSEISGLGNQLDRISERNRRTRDFTQNSLTRAIREIMASFPVYRTYVSSAQVSERDRRYIELATARAKRRNPAISESIFDFVRDILLFNTAGQLDEEGRRAVSRFVGTFQQTTGPVMAKGVEDTAFYIFNRLVSLNEVGGDPERFGTSLATFHQQNVERQANWPHSLLTTTTHDTKRSEDVRARINALSEIPAEWKSHLARWARKNRRFVCDVDGEPAPSRNDEYLLYQTLLGTWPFAGLQTGEREQYVTRIQDYAVKAAREAKVRTSWISPYEPYERATCEFITGILSPKTRNTFLDDFLPFARRIAELGIWNSLSQLVLKLTCPGIPDFYQGCELFEFRLVDPDNRGPVDFKRRAEMLEQLEHRFDEAAGNLPALAADLVASRTDGMIKLYVIRQLLNYRRWHPDLFTIGEYLPLELTGERREHVCAYSRRFEERVVIVIVPRLIGGLVGLTGLAPCGREVWGDTALVWPGVLEHGPLVNLLTGELLSVNEPESPVTMAAALSVFPVAVLECSAGI